MKKIFVDINGTPHEKSDNIEPDFKVMAKWLGSKFFVMGSNEGDLFSPLDPTANIHKRDKERGGLFWQLRICSEECYKQYTTFLRSKHKTPYLLAQRRFRNDMG